MNEAAIYQEIEISSEVMTASKHRLIQMLMEKYLQQLRLAEMYMERKQILPKCNALTKAMDIATHLHGCLKLNDPETREVAKKLEVVYIIAERHILEANMHNKVENIRIAHDVIANIKSAWDKIG